MTYESLTASLCKLEQCEDVRQAQRLFHGRGGSFAGLEWVTIDALWPSIFVTFFKSPPGEFESWLHEVLIPWCEAQTHGFQRVLVQHRYEFSCRCETLWGTTVDAQTVQRADQQYAIRFDRQNIGFFLDMEPARQWLESHVQGKSVLNLFSYTCVFSVVAMAAGASAVVNVDMSKGALSTGRHNHHLNNVSTEHVQFMPYNILKSWSRVAKQGPYDLVIVDPPSFQKGSFQASKDYIKVLRRVQVMLNPGAIVMACLNAPELSGEFIENLMQEVAPQARPLGTLPNLAVFDSKVSEPALKVQLYQF